MYVPLLKGKEGEFGALEALREDVRNQVLPLIEIPRIPYDYVNERPARSLDEHVAGVADRLNKCWPNRELFVDLPWFGEDELLEDQRVAFDGILRDCEGRRVRTIPVVSRRTSAASLAAAGGYARRSGLGTCIRLYISDFEDDVDLPAELTRLLRSLNELERRSIDLIVDLQDLNGEQTRAALIARSVFSMVPNQQEWRRVVLAGASFPEDLSEVDAATTSTLPRVEWTLWNTLQRRPAGLRPDLLFGDYAISNPTPKEIDPRTMRMSASIRYTTTDSWLVLKGRNVRQYGFDQYFELCRALTQRAEYRERDFSWGDAYIADCADGVSGPGNATTWRKVGTNHHITLVARELANLRRGA